jgi:hypothetical protein
MTYKIIMGVVAVVAVVLAVLSVTFNRDALTVVVVTSRFFEVMIPVLAVGGLVKWIFFSGCGCNCSCCKK